MSCKLKRCDRNLRQRPLSRYYSRHSIDTLWNNILMSDPISLEQNVKTFSRPSDLRITDMVTLRLTGLPMDCIIIRIDTNQGISGYGEVRDWGSKTYALMLKSRI